MTKTFFLESPTTRVAYRIYENDQVAEDKTIVFIHGAGVGGELTWQGFLPHLTKWRRIIMPDLKGMGESFSLSSNKTEEATTVDELANDMLYLVDYLQLMNFDLVGYSLGGAVSLLLNQKLTQKAQALLTSKAGALSKTNSSFNTAAPKINRMALLEPAILDRESLDALAELRQRYREAATIIRDTGDVELGIQKFVDSVSPNRRKHPVAEATTQSRLAHRPIGFSYALDAVTDLVEYYQEQPSLRRKLLHVAPPVLLLAGELSNESLHAYHSVLKQNYVDWQNEVIKGTDHSLPFQKPRQIAKLFNQWFA